MERSGSKAKTDRRVYAQKVVDQNPPMTLLHYMTEGASDMLGASLKQVAPKQIINIYKYNLN